MHSHLRTGYDHGSDPDVTQFTIKVEVCVETYILGTTNEPFDVQIISKFVCSAIQRVSFVHLFTFREPGLMRMKDQGLLTLYGSIIFHI